MVIIIGAPGYEDFEADLLCVFEAIDNRGDLAVVMDDRDELHVVPATHVWPSAGERDCE